MTGLDSTILNQWHCIGANEEIGTGVVRTSVLLGRGVKFAYTEDGEPKVWRSTATSGPSTPFTGQIDGEQLPALNKFGYLWTSFGSPKDSPFEIPELDEPDRCLVHAGTFRVDVSAPRVIENFLDMGHFPFVHTGILGIEPHTEVKEYDVDLSFEKGEILATHCKFHQPRVVGQPGDYIEADYIYRVPHPYCSVLYRINGADPSRRDIVAMFAQAINEEQTIGHMLMGLIAEKDLSKAIRLSQQRIFGQDKPILENQVPKKLPLDPRAETPIRADKTAINYRRWLSQTGVTYGVIPSAA